MTRLHLVGATIISLLPLAPGAQRGPAFPGALEEYRACLAKDADACFRVGRSYVPYRDEDPTDFVRAAHFFMMGCDAGQPDLCTEVGDFYANGRGFPVDAARARELYTRACDANGPEGCFRLGEVYERGTGVTRDPARAVTFYQRACDPGYDLACLRLAELLRTGPDAVRDVARAFTLNKAMCDRRIWFGCYPVGLAYRDGLGTVRDLATARTMLRDACNSEAGLGCAEVCEMGEAAACVKEADALDSARGVLPNPARANERYERAIRLFDADCDTGNREACQALVAINRRVRPILLTDRALAIRFHGRVCETGGEMPACRPRACSIVAGDRWPSYSARRISTSAAARPVISRAASAGSRCSEAARVSRQVPARPRCSSLPPPSFARGGANEPSRCERVEPRLGADGVVWADLRLHGDPDRSGHLARRRQALRRPRRA